MSSEELENIKAEMCDKFCRFLFRKTKNIWNKNVLSVLWISWR